MYRPSLKSGRSLISLMVLSIVLYIIASNSYVLIKTENYEQKLAAAQLMKNSMDAIKDDLNARNYEIDAIDDPLETGLVGSRLSSITTDKGLLSEKQAALNPNLAAVFVEELAKLKLEPGDDVAVGITGSNPGLNLALYSAMQVMKVNPKIIVALSSASYGANREDLTWLDMEHIIKQRGLIDFGSSYASMGGREDLAIGLSDNGIAALRDAMIRNKVPMLTGTDLADNIQIRMAAYDQMLTGEGRYKAFINIGSGLSNVGSEPNANLIPEGINRKLAEKNYDKEGVMMLMAKRSMPVLNIRRVLRWVKKYDLPASFDTMPKVGQGKVFSSMIHNQWINVICLAVLLAAIIAVIIFDRHDRRFMANIVDPDEEL